jgi:ribosomal protein L37AE/L43A
MAADVAGIYLLGLISDGRYGISKFGWLPQSIDYQGLNLIGIGFLIILLMSLLFRRTKVIVIPEPMQIASPFDESGDSAYVQVDPSNAISVSNPVRPRVSWSRILTTPLIQVRSNGQRAGRIKPMKAAPVIAPKRRRRSRKARVQLALVEDHRCPYCLETVTRNDPRGMVECTICHALHHKDCWDITGPCQVPHLNN